MKSTNINTSVVLPLNAPTDARVDSKLLAAASDPVEPNLVAPPPTTTPVVGIDSFKIGGTNTAPATSIDLDGINDGTRTIIVTISTTGVSAVNGCTQTTPSPSTQCVGLYLSTYTSTVTTGIDACGPTPTTTPCAGFHHSTYLTTKVTEIDACAPTTTTEPCLGEYLSTYTSTLTTILDACGPTPTITPCFGAYLSTYTTTGVTANNTCTHSTFTNTGPCAGEYLSTYTSTYVTTLFYCGDHPCASATEPGVQSVIPIKTDTGTGVQSIVPIKTDTGSGPVVQSIVPIETDTSTASGPVVPVSPAEGGQGGGGEGTGGGKGTGGRSECAAKTRKRSRIL